MKAARQRRIVNLIRRQPVTSQNELVKLLRSSGVPATQATVSRDLEDLGAVKVRREGKIAYALPTDTPTPVGDALNRILMASVLSIQVSGNILVLKTPPGHAGMVASALDRGEIDGIAGTIAGDDTIFAACKQDVIPRRIEKRLRSMIESMPGVSANGRADETTTKELKG
ncbi:MAG: arginine repressor [Actinomycetota bacterium]|nr:arginine repressor [Actinomycetota bacterium]